MYAKDSFKAKYQSLINKRKGEGLKYYNDSRAFIESSNNVDDIYKTTEEYNLNKGRKILIVFHDRLQIYYLLEVENKIFLLFLYMGNRILF